MLPFVVGGGIIIAASFLFENIFGSDSIPFNFLMGIGGGAFGFLLPILAGYIAYSIGDRPALMPGMVAGYLAGTGLSVVESAHNQAGAGFIGALIGGFVAGYSIIFLKKITKGLPESVSGLKPMLIYPVFGLFITGLIMFVAINPVFIVVNNFVNNFLAGLGTSNKIIIGIILGAMMAIDMGGPVNKASYVFSTGILASTGDGTFMAATMAGGMVPPIGIALATTFFKDKFTEKERQSGLTNYFLGLSFITEGAIPFAAGDPLRVIPSMIVGSALAGALTMLFDIKLRAPHGGILVMFLSNNFLMYLVAVIAGSIVSAILLGILKPKLK